MTGEGYGRVEGGGRDARSATRGKKESETREGQEIKKGKNRCGKKLNTERRQ